MASIVLGPAVSVTFCVSVFRSASSCSYYCTCSRPCQYLWVSCCFCPRRVLSLVYLHSAGSLIFGGRLFGREAPTGNQYASSRKYNLEADCLATISARQELTDPKRCSSTFIKTTPGRQLVCQCSNGTGETTSRLLGHLGGTPRLGLHCVAGCMHSQAASF